MIALDKRKLIFIGIGIALFVLIIGFLVARSLQNKPTTQSARLEFWGTFDQRAFYSEAIDAYQKEHPLISITYKEIPFADYESDLINAFSRNTGPDIWLMHNTWLPKHKDLILPLNEKNVGFTLKAFQEKFVDVAQADLLSGGQIYGMPLYVDSLALYYNKDLLNAVGITAPPRTWEEFVRQVDILTQLDDRGNIKKSAAAIGTARMVNRSTDVLMLLMMQSGTEMTNGSRTRATFAQPVGGITTGENALQFYTDFANQAKTDRYTWNDFQKYSIDAFADGNTAMMFNYSHQIKTIRAKSPRLNFSVAPMPQPQDAELKVNLANYWAPTVSKQSAVADEAWKFLVFLASTDATKGYLDVSDRPSARRDIIETQRTKPEIGTFAVQALTARSWYQIDNTAIETLFAKMIDDVNFGRFSVKNALREAESQINVIMNKAGGQ